MVAGGCEREERRRDRSLAAGDEDAVDAALEVGKAPGRNDVRRIVVARVRASAASPREALHAIVEVLEEVPRRLIDGGDASDRLRIDDLARMDLAGLESPPLVAAGHPLAPLFAASPIARTASARIGRGVAKTMRTKSAYPWPSSAPSVSTTPA